jgi:hypothetical protein
MKTSKAMNYAHDMKYKITRFTVSRPSIYPLQGHVQELVLSQSVTTAPNVFTIARNLGGWAVLGRR